MFWTSKTTANDLQEMEFLRAQERAAMVQQLGVGLSPWTQALEGRINIAAPMPDVPIPSMPEAVKIKETVDGKILSEYEELSAAIGLVTPQIAQERLIRWLKDEGVPIYDMAKVSDYMTAIARKENKEWHWKGLREGKDMSPDLGVRDDGYKKVIPTIVLRGVKKLVDKFPDARFYVTDYAVPKPDPFIAVRMPGCDLLVFDYWHEPGFKP